MLKTSVKTTIILCIVLAIQVSVPLISCSETKSQGSSAETVSDQMNKPTDKESSTMEVPVTYDSMLKHQIKVLEMTRPTVAPSSSFIKENRAVMETTGFDGMVIFMDYSKSGIKYRLQLRVFDHRYAIKPSDLQPEIDNLTKAGFVRYKDNFLGLHCSTPAGPINWFGEEDYWNIILNNIGVVAKAAKVAGLRGVMLDCENYLKKKNFYYPILNARYPGHGDREAWKAKVRLRGKQIMQKMIQGYGSDFRLMFREGLQIVRQVEEINRNHPLSTVGANGYELIPAFVNGLLEGLSSNADIVELPGDFNFKKGIPSKTSFDRIWDILKPFDGEVVTNPDYIYPQNVSTYNSKYKIGYMMWLDDKEWPNGPSYDRTAWTNNSSELTKNTWTPTTLRSWLKRCKNPEYHSVVYCVIWKGNYATNLPEWWKSGGINQQYIDVLNNEFK